MVVAAVLRRLLIPGVIATVAGFACPVAAQPTAEPVPGFAAWLDGVRSEARERGVRDDVVATALADITPVERILHRDRNQSEFKLTLEPYMNRVITEKTVEHGREMARQHDALLKKIAAKYNVQPRFMLAIWGIETRFGLVRAEMPVIPAVATLAFDRRRSKYFREQLFSVLWMLHRGYIDLPNLKGSWAGAMGQPQFMPSSYLAYAEDFDGDGRRDIWNNVGDVLASIANYLAKHGWDPGLTWGREIRLPGDFAARRPEMNRRVAPGCRAQTSELRDLGDWQQFGLRRTDGRNLPTRRLPAALIQPDGEGGRAFLVYGNYSAIMSYNCAHLYAVTVGMLSDRIRP